MRYLEVYRTGVLTGLLLAASAIGAGAQAAGACTGSMQTSLLHPLPLPLTVGSQRSIADSANPHFARQFADGLALTGISLTDTGNTTLSIAVSVSPPASVLQAGGPQKIKWFNWTSGQPVSRGQPLQIRGATLSLSAVLSDIQAATQSWVATINCTIRTDDPDELARYIGQTIGRVIGQNLDRRAI